MTADLKQPSLDEQLRTAAQDRKKLLKQLAKAARRTTKRWRVVRQFTHQAEVVVCSHHVELAAEVCSWSWHRRHRNEPGTGHYEVRRAES
jgi:Rad3-related DNA helicase